MDAWPCAERRRIGSLLEQASDLQTQRRLIALQALAQGRSIREVAVLVGVAPVSVWRWLERYRQRPNLRSMADAPRSGRPGRLDRQQRNELRELLAQSPQALGYAATTWTTPLLQTHLQAQGLTHCSTRTLRRYLHGQDLVWKRPRYVLERDPQAEEKRASSSAGSCT